MKTKTSKYLENIFKKNDLVINSRNLNELFYRLDDSYNKMTKRFLDNVTKTNIKYNNFHNFKKEVFFSNKTIYEINFDNTIIVINVYYNNEDIDNFTNHILFVIYFMLVYSNKKVNFEIDYLLTDLKKEIINREKNYIFTEDDINSGFTYLNEKKIIIWRKEEIIKVTIHELIHLLNIGLLDTKIPSKIVNFYKNKYNVSSNHILIDEAFTEFLAVLINNFLITKFMNKTYNYYVYLLKLEISFTIYQCNKIYNLGMNKDINKNTQVLSYFFIKLELFMNLDKAINCININNKNNICKLLLKDKKNFPKIQITETNKKEYKTLRMSLNEYKIF